MPLRQFFAGASGPEPFSGGRPVKSILPHIVKGQHRGTRLEKASLKVQALQAAKGKPGHASCRCLYCSGASYLEHSSKYALNVKQSEKYATQCWDRCWWCRCQPQCTHRIAYNTHKCTLVKGGHSAYLQYTEHCTQCTHCRGEQLERLTMGAQRAKA